MLFQPKSFMKNSRCNEEAFKSPVLATAEMKYHLSLQLSIGVPVMRNKTVALKGVLNN